MKLNRHLTFLRIETYKELTNNEKSREIETTVSLIFDKENTFIDRLCKKLRVFTIMLHFIVLLSLSLKLTNYIVKYFLNILVTFSRYFKEITF